MIYLQKLIDKKLITKEQGDQLMNEFKSFKGTEEEFILQKKVIKENQLNSLEGGNFQYAVL